MTRFWWLLWALHGFGIFSSALLADESEGEQVMVIRKESDGLSAMTCDWMTRFPSVSRLRLTARCELETPPPGIQPYFLETETDNAPKVLMQRIRARLKEARLLGSDLGRKRQFYIEALTWARQMSPINPQYRNQAILSVLREYVSTLTQEPAALTEALEEIAFRDAFADQPLASAALAKQYAQSVRRLKSLEKRPLFLKTPSENLPYEASIDGSEFHPVTTQTLELIPGVHEVVVKTGFPGMIHRASVPVSGFGVLMLAPLDETQVILTPNGFVLRGQTPLTLSAAKMVATYARTLGVWLFEKAPPLPEEELGALPDRLLLTVIRPFDGKGGSLMLGNKSYQQYRFLKKPLATTLSTLEFYQALEEVEFVPPPVWIAFASVAMTPLSQSAPAPAAAAPAEKPAEKGAMVQQSNPSVLPAAAAPLPNSAAVAAAPAKTPAVAKMVPAAPAPLTAEPKASPGEPSEEAALAPASLKTPSSKAPLPDLLAHSGPGAPVTGPTLTPPSLQNLKPAPLMTTPVARTGDRRPQWMPIYKKWWFWTILGASALVVTTTTATSVIHVRAQNSMTFSGSIQQ